MATMNISVPAPMRDWVQGQIESGQYASVSDYVRDLIRRDQGEADARAQWLSALDAAVAQGVADADAGRVTDADAVLDRLEAKYEAMASADAAE